MLWGRDSNRVTCHIGRGDRFSGTAMWIERKTGGYEGGEGGYRAGECVGGSAGRVGPGTSASDGEVAGGGLGVRREGPTRPADIASGCPGPADTSKSYHHPRILIKIAPRTSAFPE
jgi:hypothetical protein